MADNIYVEVNQYQANVLDTTLVKLEPVRKELLQNEVVTPRKMGEIIISPLATKVVAEIGGDGYGSLFVGAERQNTFLQKVSRTHQNDSGGWVSEPNDGRCVRHEFSGGPLLFPKIISADGDKIILSETEFVPFKGVDAKGGGMTLSFGNLSRPGMVGPGQSGVLGDKSPQFISQGNGEWWGSNDYTRRKGEYNLLARLAARGARVDYPVAVGINDDKVFPSKDLGIICRLYRTPFNFRTIIGTSGRDPDRMLYLMLDGISIWKNEGLVNDTDLKSLPSEILTQNDLVAVQKFYYLKGAEIAGRDLAIIHQEKSLGNRNPQNMGNDFSHRDVFDGNDIDRRQEMVNSLRDKLGMAKDNALKMINKMWEPISKLDDIFGDLSLIRNLSRFTDQNLANKITPEIIRTYLKSYLQQEKGLNRRQLGNMLLLSANMGMFVAMFDFDFKNMRGITGIIFREYGKVIKELESEKK